MIPRLSYIEKLTSLNLKARIKNGSFSLSSKKSFDSAYDSIFK